MIPMVDLKKQYARIKDEILKEIDSVLESSRYVLGNKVRDFEHAVARYHDVRHAVGVASGTDALNIALKALGVGEGDEVITTPFTFFATVEAIIYQRARPVFVDIDPVTMNIDVAKLESAITEKTRAILPVHLFGLPVEMDPLLEVAERHGLSVVEDTAQAFGAEYRGRKAGSFGDAGCFSFYPSKNLGAYGDGGMIITNSDEIKDKALMLRNHGSVSGYIHGSIGMNSRLDEIQAAILLVKMKRIEEFNQLRIKKAEFYTAHLSDIVVCPQVPEGFTHVFHQYTIRTPERDMLKDALSKEGISSVVYYPLPLHLQEALKNLGYREGDLPEAEKASQEVLSLPIYPELEESEQERIVKVIRDVLS
ncbi:MAG: DegT/DnrJ/EryC1/StrS family aminotransferase [Nitrospirae bacterium]|nr:MAG: DegT/DnrJ/EryC1/StrS family aminotransferase [Nitrospirota bacterium]